MASHRRHISFQLAPPRDDSSSPMEYSRSYLYSDCNKAFPSVRPSAKFQKPIQSRFSNNQSVRSVFFPYNERSGEDDLYYQIFRTEKEAATVIQAYWRGHKIRKQIYIDHCAATIIQANWRGYSVRKNMALQHSSVNWDCYREYLNKERYWNKFEAAVTTDSGCRGNHLQSKLVTEHEAAAVIQAHYRGYKTRMRFLEVKEATVCIQAYWRGYCCRRDTALQHLAATCIQAYFRGYLTRKQVYEYLNMHERPQDFSVENYIVPPFENKINPRTATCNVSYTSATKMTSGVGSKIQEMHSKLTKPVSRQGYYKSPTPEVETSKGVYAKKQPTKKRVSESLPLSKKENNQKTNQSQTTRSTLDRGSVSPYGLQKTTIQSKPRKTTRTAKADIKRSQDPIQGEAYMPQDKILDPHLHKESKIREVTAKPQTTGNTHRTDKSFEQTVQLYLVRTLEGIGKGPVTEYFSTEFFSGSESEFQKRPNSPARKTNAPSHRVTSPPLRPVFRFNDDTNQSYRAVETIKEDSQKPLSITVMLRARVSESKRNVAKHDITPHEKLIIDSQEKNCGESKELRHNQEFVHNENHSKYSKGDTFQKTKISELEEPFQKTKISELEEPYDLQKMKMLKHTDKINTHSSHIQANQKGYHTKTYTQKQNKDSAKSQAYYQGQKSQEEYEGNERTYFQTRSKSPNRTRTDREHPQVHAQQSTYQPTKKTELLIKKEQSQSTFLSKAGQPTTRREFKTRRRYQEQAKAASKIQAAWKGYRTRKEIMNKNKAAQKIQAAFRGYSARKYLSSVGIIDGYGQKDSELSDEDMFSPPPINYPTAVGE
ncbi:unconventional myosin-Va [Latimeria chalumnae]|uniref:unconventional myosin-Va n=1 Tax=Latimeria chalumnae TaxID=7897 RepID=UPI0006D92FCE|nr:PREDICTED: uncharacterized protein KIAA1683 homolog isoform X2 [Latimeria chalumnae]|eukprot:XP_014342241.1 PREDICTED: uncharacterized protein KIAA1683 homolog isoform X2 [Latimeria chalumnae]